MKRVMNRLRENPWWLITKKPKDFLRRYRRSEISLFEPDRRPIWPKSDTSLFAKNASIEIRLEIHRQITTLRWFIWTGIVKSCRKQENHRVFPRYCPPQKVQYYDYHSELGRLLCCGYERVCEVSLRQCRHYFSWLTPFEFQSDTTEVRCVT
jgi:hypothetical protein